MEYTKECFIMKKKYIIPCTSIIQAQAEQMLASSDVISGNSDINIGYGGVDDDGTLTPSAKECDWDMWTDN